MFSMCIFTGLKSYRSISLIKCYCFSCYNRTTRLWDPHLCNCVVHAYFVPLQVDLIFRFSGNFKTLWYKKTCSVPYINNNNKCLWQVPWLMQDENRLDCKLIWLICNISTNFVWNKLMFQNHITVWKSVD